MKILRLLFACVFTVLLYSSCQKSSIRPHACDEQSAAGTEVTPSDDLQKNQGRSSSIDEPVNPPATDYTENSLMNDEGGTSTVPGDVSGSGDDDRDGGDKRKRR